jgi:hypothetical protein
MSGCGYKPSSRYARDVVGDKVSVQVVISAADPQNTVMIKDALSDAVVQNFRSRLTQSANASTHLIVKLANVSYSPIQYNSNGYIISYRMYTTLIITMMRGGHLKSYSESGTYDFSIEPNAIISDQVRLAAIKHSASKAIAAFVSQMAASGARKEKK